MGSAELSEWMAYWQLEPWGAWRDNWHSAQIATLIYNSNRGKAPAVKASEFMYVERETKAKIGAKTFAARLRAMVKKDG